VRDDDTLDAINEVYKVITRYSLEKISFFNTFLFYKIPVSKSLDKYKEELDEVYTIFL